MVVMLGTIFVSLFWGSDLMLRYGRAVLLVIAAVGFLLGELLWPDHGVRQVARRDGGPPRHRKER